MAADLKEKKVNYNNNPILKWCLTNTVIKVDDNENIRPIKSRNQRQRIDGTVSLIDAYVVYSRHRDDYQNMMG
jgi:phage terminase large subunit-like protein